MVAGLGAAWILDGLQITIASSVSPVLTSSQTLGLSSSQVGLIASVYLIGEVVGALYFGKLSDKLGRKRLLVVTLSLYLCGTGLTAFTTGHHTGWQVFFYGTRFIAGMGIGGQYAAINSAIDEMMPSKYRGRVDIWINGTYWAGAIIGSFASYIFLNAFAVNVGWRLAFLLGPVLALVVLVVARVLPESPRWLMTHGREEEAERELKKIEEGAVKSGQTLVAVDDSDTIELVPEKDYGYLVFLRMVFKTYPKRAVLGASLMVTQSFLYNAIFFTYALVLTKFYGVSTDNVPLYGLAFSVGNLAGPLSLGKLFDTLGRKIMISGTYILSGFLLAVSAFLFLEGVLNAATQTLVWVVIFFFASAGASSAYLTVSETWPIEIRAEAIAVFFAIAQVFGALGPVLYGALIGNGSSRTGLTIGYLIGGAIMVAGGLVEVLFGINAEGQSLETITKPLTSTGPQPTETEADAAAAALEPPPDTGRGGPGHRWGHWGGVATACAAGVIILVLGLTHHPTKARSTTETAGTPTTSTQTTGTGTTGTETTGTETTTNP
jgi:MFS family permease